MKSAGGAARHFPDDLRQVHAHRLREPQQRPQARVASASFKPLDVPGLDPRFLRYLLLRKPGRFSVTAQDDAELLLDGGKLRIHGGNETARRRR